MLCYKYGEKWGHNHKCSTQVSLHVIEEFLDALEHTTNCNPGPSDDEVDTNVVMVVGDTTPQVCPKRRTMRLHGTIDIQEVLILVDSGSVGSFISENLAAQLQYPLQDCAAAHFVAADGSPMTCTRRVLNLQWASQIHTFLTDVGILPLKCYDMIVGKDWLEDSSPM